MKNKIMNYLKCEEAASGTVETVLMIIAAVALIAAVIAWIWSMVDSNMDSGSSKNDNYNSIVNGIS